MQSLANNSDTEYFEALIRLDVESDSIVLRLDLDSVINEAQVHSDPDDELAQLVKALQYSSDESKYNKQVYEGGYYWWSILLRPAHTGVLSPMGPAVLRFLKFQMPVPVTIEGFSPNRETYHSGAFDPIFFAPIYLALIHHSVSNKE